MKTTFIHLGNKISQKQLAFAVLATMFLLFVFVVNSNDKSDTAPTTTPTIESIEVGNQPENTDNVAVSNNLNSQNDMLLYLIEEEKLAHDVYTVLYQIYGTKVFANILQSEQTHQNKVLSLLDSRHIEDPRSNALGVFTNTNLQALYDKLVEQGKQSLTNAFLVGIAIEEKDIADITKQLATATDQDILSVLNSLRSGSENHLRAFNRQIGKY